MPNPYAIVVCCTQNWLPLAACTLLSCFQQGADAQSDLFVVTINADAEDKAKITAFLAQHGANVHVIDAVFPDLLQSLVSANSWGVGAMARMALTSFLPPHYRRVLYLDSDILALTSITPLLEAKLNGKMLGAVEDYHSMPWSLQHWHDHPRKIGLPRGARYFNSGMMLFDWQQLLKNDLLQQSTALWYAKLQAGIHFSYPDQDALNLGFQGNWQPLPVAMNAASVMVDYFPEKPILRHFSAHYRPWAHWWMPGAARHKQLYRALLKDSPWPEFEIKDFTTLDVKEIAGVLLRKLDVMTRARYRLHVKSGLQP
ncbi:glycosyltransferase family 8 protein [Aestuariivirga litoralis]|uniref:glycosyltransferase family 8 protein n=1 Tax=Aestuariivirga litoralis TaxID=2650924 RepID=UPI0018C774F4|nr:glycosyltransferase [Aestuariivirga litoralis]MBG1230990.1 hypothetical protein [Aestuariivirga litoralis]